VADSDPAFDVPVPVPVLSDAVERSVGGSLWSVSGCGWDADGVALPEEYAALLAPPIVVGAAAMSPERVARRIPDTAPPPPPPASPSPSRPDGRRSTLEMLIFEPRPPGRHRRR
jgi:hypothetical protein